MVRLLIMFGSGLFNSIVWTWLASLVLSPAHAVALGVVAGLATMLVVAALQTSGDADDLAPSPIREPATPMEKSVRSYLPEL